MSSHPLEKEILNVLREAGKPMRALDIGKKLGFDTRREVNRVIYKMRGVKQLNNPSGPPLWQLETSIDSNRSIAQGSSGRESAPTNQLSGQLSKISIGNEGTATWNDGACFLGTMEPTTDGRGIIMRPLARDEIISRGGRATSTVMTCGPLDIQATPDDDESRLEGESRQPVQETAGYPNDISAEPYTVTQSIDPINLMEGTKVKKEFEKGAGDNPGKKAESECADQKVVPDAKEDSTSHSLVSATAAKRKPKIAANFSLSLQAQKKEKILKLLADGPLDTHQVSIKLGMPTRVEAMQLLEELQHDGRVNSIDRNGVSVWSVKH